MKNFIVSMLLPKTGFDKLIIFVLVVSILVLNFLGYLNPIIEVLSSNKFTFKIGDFSISLFTALKGVFALFVLFWGAGFISSSGEKTIRKFKKIKSSNRALLIKGYQSFVYFILFLVGLEVLGIDLTTFAVFGGAIGIGIGFGLQKITSNFISGIILLFEKSVEEGDLIEMGDGTYGFVRETNARYTLIETFENKEILIPNEDFITSRVTNWTYTNNKGRVEIKIGVSYDSDIELARELILKSAMEHERCSKDPEPKCFLEDFGDSAVMFVLHFWVDDVTEGRMEPHSDVMMEIWNKLKDNKISIPFPQRDITIKNPEAFK